jgi:hypothetical protein
VRLRRRRLTSRSAPSKSGRAALDLLALAVDAVGDTAEQLFDGVGAGAGVQAVERGLAVEGAVGSLQPTGDFLLAAQNIFGHGEDAGHADGAVGLFGGEAGGAAAEGAGRDAEHAGDLGARQPEVGGERGEGVGGQALAGELDELAGGADAALQDGLPTQDFGDGVCGHR